jgi:cytochrome c biogenesis protein CcdA
MLNVSLPAAALGGLISFLSPCVLPLVPPYLSFLAGTTFDRLNAGDGAVRRRAVLAALLFVAGFSTVFVLLGATASALGQVIRQYLDVLSTIAGLSIIVMGLHFLGVFRIGFLYREARFNVNRPVGLWGAYVMGLAFAFGWTPCIGPVLAAILAVAGSETDVLRLPGRMDQQHVLLAAGDVSGARAVGVARHRKRVVSSPWSCDPDGPIIGDRPCRSNFADSIPRLSLPCSACPKPSFPPLARSGSMRTRLTPIPAACR